MTADYDRHHPWRCWVRGLHAGRATTKQAAMNLADRPWRAGEAIVRNERTGEEWTRRRHWFKTAHATKAKSSDAPASMTAGSGAGMDQGASPAAHPGEPIAVAPLKQGVLL